MYLFFSGDPFHQSEKVFAGELPLKGFAGGLVASFDGKQKLVFQIHEVIGVSTSRLMIEK